MKTQGFFYITKSENIMKVAGYVCSKSANGKFIAGRLFGSKLDSLDLDSFEFTIHTNQELKEIIDSPKWKGVVEEENIDE